MLGVFWRLFSFILIGMHCRCIPILKIDKRFTAVEDEKLREELFGDYMIDLEREEREEKRKLRKQNIHSFRDYLRECDWITTRTQWRHAREKLKDDERLVLWS